MVHSGRFASVDHAMAEAASLLVERLQHKQNPATPPVTTQAKAVPVYKPIGKVADELRKSVPPEEWAKLPVDGASQRDRYIYGTPKRPTSRVGSSPTTITGRKSRRMTTISRRRGLPKLL